MRVSVIIPAYNEQDTIVELLQRLKKLDIESEIIVVNDCSEDDTAERVRQQQFVKLINHPYRMGNGSAIKTGLRASTGDVVVMLDADLQHPPEKIPDLLLSMQEYDMVVAARTSNSKVSLFRSFGNFLLKTLAQYLSRHKIMDLTSGFRALKRSVAMEFIHLLPNGYSYTTTFTIALFKSGYFVKYYPVDSIKKREQGISNIKPFRNGSEFILLMTRLIMLFDPLRIFIPVSVFILIAGLGLAIYQILVLASVEGASILLILSGLFVFFFGLIADQSASIRREICMSQKNKE